MIRALLTFLLLLTLSAPSQAQFPFPVNHFSGGVSGSGFLDDAGLYPNVSSSVCGQIAAGVAASIANNSPVSEEFLNLIASPADSTDQNENDFHNGAAASTDGDELALSGAAGTNTNYLSGDGSADFSVLKAVGTGSILGDWHRTDQAGFWIALAFRYEDIGNNQTLFGNRSGGVGGVDIQTRSTDIIRFIQTGDSGNDINDTTATLTDGVDYVLIITWDGTSSSSNIKFYINSDTVTETKSSALNTATSSHTLAPGFMAARTGGEPMGSSTRMYGVAWGNAFIGDTEAAEIRDWFQLNTPIS